MNLLGMIGAVVTLWMLESGTVAKERLALMRSVSNLQAVAFMLGNDRNVHNERNEEPYKGEPRSQTDVPCGPANWFLIMLLLLLFLRNHWQSIGRHHAIQIADLYLDLHYFGEANCRYGDC